MFEIDYYRLPNGVAPVEGFIDGLPPKLRAKTMRALELLEDKGADLREPYSKELKDGLFELRIRFSNDISRVFYFFYVGKRVIVTNGFVKKTQKTPRREIEKALRFKRDWEARHGDE